MPNAAVTTYLQNRIANPLMCRNPLQTPLETTTRTSREPRTTPLGGRLVDNQFWFVSEIGEKARYVRHIQAAPRGRVRLRGKWHSGPAHLVPDDDAQARLRKLPQFNSFGARTFGTNLLIVRADFDQQRPRNSLTRPRK